MVYLFTGHETVVVERDSMNPLSFDFVCDRETRLPHVMFGLQRTHANMKDQRIINRPGKRPASTDGGTRYVVGTLTAQVAMRADGALKRRKANC